MKNQFTRLFLLFCWAFTVQYCNGLEIMQRTMQVNQNGCTMDEYFTKQKGCIYKCQGSYFLDCPHFQSAPHVCALKNDGSWVPYTDQCQPCLEPEVIGVTKSPCQIILPPILFSQQNVSYTNISYCVKNQNCKQTQICDFRTNICIEQCAALNCLYGCSKGKCLPPPLRACTSDADCKTQQNCQNNRCLNLCSISLCLSNSKCYKGQCYPLSYCLSNKQCKINETCYLGKCSAVRQVCGNITCQPGAKCYNKKCYSNLNQTKCAKNRCKQSQVCSYGLCINKCMLVKCTAGFECVNGQCMSVNLKCNKNEDCGVEQQCRNQACENVCKSVKCKMGQFCFRGACIYEPKKFQNNNACGYGQDCFNGICVDKCNGVKCSFSQICVQGACCDSNCDNKACPSGSYCKNGQCVPNVLACASPQLNYAAVSCTNPRPNYKSCPSLNASQKLFCGIKADGTRISFASSCQACKDASIEYYFDKPCIEAPFICTKQEKCLNYYCSSAHCLRDQQCHYDWQVCNVGGCVDKCAIMNCEGCKFGICNYENLIKRNCTVNSDCGIGNWVCQASKCTDSCVHLSCPSNQICSKGVCVAP